MLNVCVSAIAALLLQAAPPQPAATPHPDLTGTWTLNRDQSTPAGAARAPEDGREGGGGRHGGGMGGGGGMGRHGGMGGMGGGERGEGERGGARNPEQMAAQRAVMQEILEPRPKFTIVAHEEKITFAEPDGWTRTYEANGEEQKHQEMSGTIETKSRWNGQKLEIDMKTTSGGLAVTRTYEISGSAPRQLIVTTKLSGGERGNRQPIKWVYDEVSE